MNCFIGLGSNVGDRKKNCEMAVTKLQAHPQIGVIRTSQWHVTKAVCLPGETQPDFINGVCELETSLNPEELHKILKEIEKEIGRQPNPKRWQPRVIDLDILFYGEATVETPDLKIPHPLAHKRLFVLAPLCEIAPDLLHPILKKTVASLHQEVLKTLQ